MEVTMSDDLKLVQQLEKEIGIQLKRVHMKEIGRYDVTGFEADHNGWVRGLAIWGENLPCLPALLSKFQRLEKLVLKFNQISDISSLKELKGLTYLSLGNNQISDISSLKELKGLTDLYLASNQISDISSLKELKNLKELYLMANKITHMPAEFLDLGPEIKWEWKGEEGIFLADNPLESPPVEIIEQGNEAIRQYFKSLAGDRP
jgi:internalin A